MRSRQEGGSGWGTHVNPWLIHVRVWQKPLQYCKVISLRLTKINWKKKKRNPPSLLPGFWCLLSLLEIRCLTAAKLQSLPPLLPGHLPAMHVSSGFLRRTVVGFRIRPSQI